MQINTGILLATEQEIRAAYRLATHGIKALQRNGHRITPTDRQLVADLGRALSDHGHTDVRQHPENVRLPVVISEPLTTEQVASILHISTRQARRLAKIYATKTGSGWIWEAATVEELLAERERKCTTHQQHNSSD